MEITEAGIRWKFADVANCARGPQPHKRRKNMRLLYQISLILHFTPVFVSSCIFSLLNPTQGNIMINCIPQLLGRGCLPQQFLHPFAR